MSDVTAAPAASTDAQPAAVARAPVGAQAEESKSALAVLKEIREQRKLKLVKKDDEPTISPEASTEVETSPQAEQEAAPEENTSDEPPVDKQPTWAQKLRADLSKKTETVKQLEAKAAERDAKFAEAHQQVQWKIEDAQADVAAEQAYSKMLEQAIEQAGFTVPHDWKARMLAERERDGLKRQLARGQSMQARAGHEKAGEAAKTQLNDLGKTIPEVAAALGGKDAEMNAWLKDRFAVDENGKATGYGFKNLERDAAIFAKSLRFERANKAQKKTTPVVQNKPAENARPASTTLAGQGQGAGHKRSPAIPQNEKESVAFLASRRATRK